MKIHPIPVAIVLILLSFSSVAQQESPFLIQLRSGNFIPEKNITPEGVTLFSKQLQPANGKSVCIIQFEKIPGETQKKLLASSGIRLMDYIPSNAYTATIFGEPAFDMLKQSGARAVFKLSPLQKMHPALAGGRFPSWALKTPGMIDLWISFPVSFTAAEVIALLGQAHIPVTETAYKDFGVLGLLVPRNRLMDLVSLPFIDYAEPAPHGDQSLNLENKNATGGHVLNTGIASGGFDLKGQNVVVGIGDNADASYHVDFTGRLVNFGPAEYAYHGTHVHGTVGGAGNRAEDYSGFAPKSTIITQYYSRILSNTPVYVSEYGMVITNNSYGDIVNDCDYMGYYDLQSRIMDLHASAFPNLQHVFAAGNDGGLTCAPYPANFRTVLSGYQAAKNVITVGGTNRDGSVASFSARGPVQDGRTKPEIMADGVSTISTTPDDSYNFSSGTSMASPAVAGGLALMYERYRQLHGGADPLNGLMKALICNGGKDAGDNGPDFTYGFGNLDLLRSVDMLNNNRYFIAAISQGSDDTHMITVPAGTAELRVMLYWNDPAAAVYAAKSLVNDLDLEVITPLPATILPFVLNAAPAGVNQPATSGPDHMNNIEQVVIKNPQTGTYDLMVSGFNVPSGPQPYFLVYDLVPLETKITFPVGAEKLNPSETMNIQWQSFGDPSNTFTVEYSVNDGVSWILIDASVPADQRNLSWVVPAVVTDKARIRVSRNGTSLSSTSNAFVIIGVPVVTVSPVQCEGYFAFNWTAVSGAADYELFQLQGTEMASMGTTTSTNYTLSGLKPDSEYFISVAARVNGNRGRRALAIKRIPNNGSCNGNISDDDLKLDSIISPVYGRIGTSTALTATTTVKARVKNLDDANVTSFDIRYSVNSGPWITESVNTTVAGGAYYTHSFSTPADFSAPGDYQLSVEVLNTTNGPGSDPVATNNIITDTIRQLNNLPLTIPFMDDLESAAPRKYYKKTFGLEGADRYDFYNTMTLGRLSTYLISGFAYSGSRSLIMDLDGYNGAAGNTNFVYGTYNLAGNDASARDLRLDMQFKSHGDSVSHPNNRIWIRGDDSSTWIEAFVLSANKNEPGVFKKTPSIELSNLLIEEGQNYSSSFQVRFGQFGKVRVMDNTANQGHNFDDIRIYEAIDDVQLVSIDAPSAGGSCDLGSSVPVLVSVRNASPATLNNIPVSMVIDGGVPVTEIISSLSSRSAVQYQFNAGADLSAPGTHTIKVYTGFPTDNLHENDTSSLSLLNLPVITAYPYLENFESNDGFWYPGGKNSSWEYGTPSSGKITTAASGLKVWKTSLDGNYNNDEQSYLYSPCFDLTGLSSPTLSFSAALDLEDCGGVYCDGAYVEYSTDGIFWQRLGNTISGTNWYNRDYGSGNMVWSIQNYTPWHVVTASLPTGIASIRLRIVMQSDPFVNFEGIAVDDIHIYDGRMEIYDGITMTSPVSQTVSPGTDWVDISANGQLLASLLPGNNNLANVVNQVFISTDPVRSENGQYYLDRNLVIRPSESGFTDSVGVRIYFLDTESELLRQAAGCPACTRPVDAYRLGVTKYSDSLAQFENGIQADDTLGNWHYFTPANVTVVPYQKGYYAEFRTKSFSEFWLNDGGAGKEYGLRTEFIDFTAKKTNGNEVDLKWTVNKEYNVVRYDVMVARGEQNYLASLYTKIGEVNGSGISPAELNYSFTDTETGKTGKRYYRIKVIYTDGGYTYSATRSVIFYEGLTFQVYPNPSAGIFNLVYQLPEGKELTMQIYGMDGRRIRTDQFIASGYLEIKQLDLSQIAYADGMYVLRISSGKEQQVLRVVKRGP